MEPGGIPSTAAKTQFSSMNPCTCAGPDPLDHLQVLPPFGIYPECYSNDTQWSLRKIMAVNRMYIKCVHQSYSIWWNVTPRHKFSTAWEEKENPLDFFDYSFHYKLLSLLFIYLFIKDCWKVIVCILFYHKEGKRQKLVGDLFSGLGPCIWLIKESLSFWGSHTCDEAVVMATMHF